MNDLTQQRLSIKRHHRIGWAYSLRELNRIDEAKVVLLEAESHLGATSAVLHYNLACYHCLLGEMKEARARLRTACKMHPPFKSEALDDLDLEKLWGEGAKRNWLSLELFFERWKR